MVRKALICGTVVGAAAFALTGCGMTGNAATEQSPTPTPTQSAVDAYGFIPGDPDPNAHLPITPAPGKSESFSAPPGFKLENPKLGSNQACRNVGNGDLCVMTDPKGYRTSYHKQGGSPVWLDFNLVCGSKRFGDAGKFKAETGQVRSYVFAVGNQGACTGWLYVREPSDTTMGPWGVGPVNH